METHKKGRPLYQRTENDGVLVSVLAGAGIPQKQIALALGIGINTLRRHFKDELVSGLARTNAKVLGTLFKLATSGKDVGATIFWCKTRLGWKETAVTETVNPAAPAEAKMLLDVITAELADQPEVRYRIARRLHEIEMAAAKQPAGNVQ